MEIKTLTQDDYDIIIDLWEKGRIVLQAKWEGFKKRDF